MKETQKNKKNANKIKEMSEKLLYNSSSNSNVEGLEETMLQQEKQLKLKRKIVKNKNLWKSLMMIIIEKVKFWLFLSNYVVCLFGHISNK